MAREGDKERLAGARSARHARRVGGMPGASGAHAPEEETMWRSRLASCICVLAFVAAAAGCAGPQAGGGLPDSSQPPGSTVERVTLSLDGYKCPTCGSVYFSLENLNVHLKQAHGFAPSEASGTTPTSAESSPGHTHDYNFDGYHWYSDGRGTFLCTLYRCTGCGREKHTSCGR